MLLTQPDAAVFFTLHRTLMFFVNQRLQVLAEHPATPNEFATLPPEIRLKVRNACLGHTDLIQAFVDENPAGFAQGALDIVRSWKHLVHRKFYIFRELARYTVFLASGNPSIAYGVVALSQPFEQLVGPHLPVMVETVLLPFQGKIVYDGLLSTFNISFGEGIRRMLNESFKAAKEQHGIVTSLPMSNEPLPPKVPRAKPTPKPPSTEEKDEVVRVIIGLIDQFCREHLNEEYAVLCRKMAEKLGRKRPSPLLSGRPNAWASGIVRAVGGANFLHDKSQTPYMRSTDIDHYLGTSPSSGAAKLAAIRKMLRIHPLDPSWTLPSRLHSNPMVWLCEVNGFVMDLRKEPREVQEAAFNRGLIPYIPADRQEG